jgi:hypothetical protein
MRTIVPTRLMLLAGFACLVTTGSAVRAQVPDHLKCYKIRDTVTKVRYTANLGGLVPENGCQIRMPGKLLCTAATKTSVSPAPPGGGPSGTNAGQFVCYKIKCPKGTLPGVPVHDQFGNRTVTPSVARMLCAPYQPAPSTTTSTTVHATTSTTIGVTTTTTPGATTTTTAGATTTTTAGATTTTTAGATTTTTTAGATTTTTTAGATTTTTLPTVECGLTAPACNGPCADPGQVCSLVFTAANGPSCACVTGTVACNPSSDAGACGLSSACPSGMGLSCSSNPCPSGVCPPPTNGGCACTTF